MGEFTVTTTFTKTTYKMQVRALLFFFILSTFAFFHPVNAGGGGGKGHETVKIIIPVHEKTIKHTHTIYKTIHHDSGKKDIGLELEALKHGGGGGGGGFGWW